MPRLKVVRESEIKVSGRVLQIRSMFDVQPGMGARVEWDVDVPLDERPWGVGLIVGPSGSGKSTLARELFGPAVVERFDWPADRSIVDGFPAALPTDDVAGFLTSVGFGSVPDWMRPFHVLSTGQQFRATLARALAEGNGLVCVDEFTSVVDRQVGQVCAHAVSKAARRMGRQFVAVTCHDDVEAWLCPDWVLDFQSGAPVFSWRSVQRRPAITAEVVETTTEAWRLFKRHHYLTADISPALKCYIALVDGRPVAHVGAQYQPLSRTPSWHITRLVVLPEWQGCGVGMALLEHVAAIYQKRSPHRVRIGTRAPGLLKALDRSNRWRCTKPVHQTSIRRGAADAASRLQRSAVLGEVVATFEWVG